MDEDETVLADAGSPAAAVTYEDVRAWVGCLACYNGGTLNGRWVPGVEAGDVTVASLHPDFVPVKDWPEEMRYSSGDLVMLPNGEFHEELWVFDHEGYGGFLTGECSPAEAQEKAELLQQVDDGPYEAEAFAAYAGHVGAYANVEDFEKAYAGEFPSDVAFAQELAEDIGAVNEDATWPNNCIDWEYAARELMYDYFEEGGYYFRRI